MSEEGNNVEAWIGVLIMLCVMGVIGMLFHGCITSAECVKVCGEHGVAAFEQGRCTCK